MPVSASSLQTNHTDDSVTWDFMAKRELEAPGAGEELQSAAGRASDIARREERCSQVYEEGVKSLNTGNTHTHIHTYTHTYNFCCRDFVTGLLVQELTRQTLLHDLLRRELKGMHIMSQKKDGLA